VLQGLNTLDFDHSHLNKF